MRIKKEQIEMIQKVIDLKKENPAAEIKVCVDNDLSEDHGWTSHKIQKVELSSWINVNDSIYTDEDLAKDAIEDMFFDDEKDLEKLSFKTNSYFEKHAVGAICIFTVVN